MSGWWRRFNRQRLPEVLLAVTVLVGAALVPLTLTAAAAGPAYTYSPIASVPIGTTEAQSVVLHDKVYLLGGFDVWKPCCTPTDRVWLYDPVANNWTSLPPMPNHGVSHAGIDSDGNRYVYYAGGYAADASATNQVYGTTDAWRFDTSSGSYTRMPSLPQSRAAGGLAYVAGKLYYFGGTNLARTQDSADVWMLDVAAGSATWVSVAAMPGPRNHLGWAVIAGQVFVVGGQHLTDSGTAQAELDRYDPGSNTWTRLTGLPVARSHVMDSTFVIDGRLVVAGGWTTTSVSASVTAYDPRTNSWQSWPDLPQARTSATGKSISGGRFVFCCGSAGTSNSNGWLAVPPVAPVTSPAPTSSSVAAPTTAPPGPAPTTAPAAPTTPAPTTAPAAPTISTGPTASATPSPPTSSQPAQIPVAKAALSQLSLHPSTVPAVRAGTVTVFFWLNHAARLSAVLRRCLSTRCVVVARATFSAPSGPSHVSLHAIIHRHALPVAHYRLTLTPLGGLARTLRIVVIH